VFKNILVPVDFSEATVIALSTAATLALQGKAVVTLLHVIESVELVPQAELQSFYDQLTAVAQRQMTSAAGHFQEQGITVCFKILIGRRAEEIVRYAAGHSIDLIVCGSHRFDPEQPSYAIGTVSHTVAVLAQCAVLLVK
jgi:nucleotide-binding universal stress UspA family protein